MAAPLAEMLWELSRRQVRLWLDGDQLRFRPRSVVPPSLQNQLQTLKQEVVELLRLPGACEWSVGELALIVEHGLKPEDEPEVGAVKRALASLGGLALAAFTPRPCTSKLSPDWRELYEERAAIMEFDGNLPLDRAEQLALADIRALMDGSGRKLRSEVR